MRLRRGEVDEIGKITADRVDKALAEDGVLGKNISSFREDVERLDKFRPTVSWTGFINVAFGLLPLAVVFVALTLFVNALSGIGFFHTMYTDTWNRLVNAGSLASGVLWFTIFAVLIGFPMYLTLAGLGWVNKRFEEGSDFGAGEIIKLGGKASGWLHRQGVEPREKKKEEERERRPRRIEAIIDVWEKFKKEDSSVEISKRKS